MFLHLHPCRCYCSSPTVDADPGYTQQTLEITGKQLVSTHELPQYHYQGMKRDGSRQKFSGTLNVRFPLHMGASENNGTPKSSILIGFSIINHPFWGTTILGNPHIKKLL